MSKPKAPQPPDYVGAAHQQGLENIQAAIAQGVMNRPNQTNPYGSQTWNQTGNFDMGNGISLPQFTNNTQLSPTGQKLFDKSNALSTGMMDLGDFSLKNAQGALSKPFDPSANRDSIVDSMYRRQTRLLDPYYKQQGENTEANLVAKGFSTGNEGYTRAMDNFQRNKDSAYQDAMDRASITGAQQAIQESLISRNQPLTELNAIRTGAMPGMPQFGQQTQAGNVGASPVMAGTQAAGAAGMQGYGIQAGNYNNMMSGLSNLGAGYFMGGGGMGGLAGMFSGGGLTTDAAMTGAADLLPYMAALA